MAVDWSRGYTASWRVFRVDERTWADAERLDGIVSADVSRDRSGDAPLLESGTVRASAPIGADVPDRYLRIVMTATQGAVSERVDVATMLFCAASGEVARGSQLLELTGRSVLWPASAALLSRGSYAPAGCDGASFAAGMLREVLAAPVAVNGSFTLDRHVVFDLGSSVLEAAWLVLRAGNFCIRIDGSGAVTVGPEPSEPDLVLDRAGARLLSVSGSFEADSSEVPNRYVAVDGTETAEAVNDDPGSKTSTVRRGYRVDVVDSSPVRVNGETLAAYCARRLEEESAMPDTKTYTREWWPGVGPYSLVRGSLASVGVEGDLRVVSQSLECGRGITVTERASREVRLWRRA